ncbi:MAG: PaaI family thioesterase [Pseudomonadota bacterium]
MTPAEIEAYLLEAFPQAFACDALSIEHVGAGEARLRLSPDDRHLRPGNVISGPTLMMLADAAAYVALLAINADAKMAVTSNLNVSFLRSAPPGEPIIQTAEVIKPGRRLSVIVGEALSLGGKTLAHTTMTYAMPTAAD